MNSVEYRRDVSPSDDEGGEPLPRYDVRSDVIFLACGRVWATFRLELRRLHGEGDPFELQANRVLGRHHARSPAEDSVSQVQYLDMKTYLVGDILTKVDRASMAHALEVREPLLDHKLMEWWSGLPPSFKLHGREGKYIFKKALEPYLPNEVLYRPKMGFSVPLAAWFRGPLRERVREAVLGPTLKDTGIFNQVFLKELVEQHQSGRRDHSATLWTMLMFEAYQRRAIVG